MEMINTPSFFAYNVSMCPRLFGWLDLYVTFIVIGVIASFTLIALYFRYKKFSKRDLLDVLICGSFAIAFGFVGALVFEAIYEGRWNWGLTFYGGLFGGIAGFLFVYYVFIRKSSTLKIAEVFKIAPPAITIGHAFGRIGCFLDGCCYGKPTTSWIGVKFPLLPEPVIPTQLIESAFLFLLTGILLVLVLVFKFKYTFIVYLGSYSIFRFIIEFFRGDDRGNFLGIFSPSQVWSMFIWVIIVPFFFVLKKLVFVEKKPDDKEQNN